LCRNALRADKERLKVFRTSATSRASAARRDTVADTMNKLLACSVLIVVAATARSDNLPTKVVVSESNDIGFATVADAITALKARGLVEIPAFNGEVSFVEPDNTTSWTFTQNGNPAHPSTVRYVETRKGDVLNIEITFLCEAKVEACEKLRSATREDIDMMSRMIAGDPTVQCRVNGATMKCGHEPVRKQTNQQVFVRIQDDGTCTVDGSATPCLEVGKNIRASHPTDTPKLPSAGARIQNTTRLDE
jgi:hypothetical protein